MARRATRKRTIRNLFGLRKPQFQIFIKKGTNVSPVVSQTCQDGEHSYCFGYAQMIDFIDRENQSNFHNPDGNYQREGTQPCECACHKRRHRRVVVENVAYSYIVPDLGMFDDPESADSRLLEEDTRQYILRRRTEEFSKFNIAPEATRYAEFELDEDEAAQTMSNARYQQAARRSRDVYHDGRAMLDLAVVGMGGEAGELLNLYEKLYFHGHPYDREHLIEELGDMLWYFTLACDYACISIGEVMHRNIEKLKVRYPNGWTSEDSIARRDHDANATRPIEVVPVAQPVPAPRPVPVTRPLESEETVVANKRTLRRTKTHARPESTEPATDVPEPGTEVGEIDRELSAAIAAFTISASPDSSQPTDGSPEASLH